MGKLKTISLLIVLSLLISTSFSVKAQPRNKNLLKDNNEQLVQTGDNSELTEVQKKAQNIMDNLLMFDGPLESEKENKTNIQIQMSTEQKNNHHQKYSYDNLMSFDEEDKEFSESYKDHQKKQSHKQSSEQQNLLSEKQINKEIKSLEKEEEKEQKQQQQNYHQQHHTFAKTKQASKEPKQEVENTVSEAPVVETQKVRESHRQHHSFAKTKQVQKDPKQKVENTASEAPAETQKVQKRQHLHHNLAKKTTTKSKKVSNEEDSDYKGELLLDGPAPIDTKESDFALNFNMNLQESGEIEVIPQQTEFEIPNEVIANEQEIELEDPVDQYLETPQKTQIKQNINIQKAEIKTEKVPEVQKEVEQSEVKNEVEQSEVKKEVEQSEVKVEGNTNFLKKIDHMDSNYQRTQSQQMIHGFQMIKKGVNTLSQKLLVQVEQLNNFGSKLGHGFSMIKRGGSVLGNKVLGKMQVVNQGALSALNFVKTTAESFITAYWFWAIIIAVFAAALIYIFFFKSQKTILILHEDLTDDQTVQLFLQKVQDTSVCNFKLMNINEYIEKNTAYQYVWSVQNQQNVDKTVKIGDDTFSLPEAVSKVQRDRYNIRFLVSGPGNRSESYGSNQYAVMQYYVESIENEGKIQFTNATLMGASDKPKLTNEQEFEESTRGFTIKTFDLPIREDDDSNQEQPFGAQQTPQDI